MFQNQTFQNGLPNEVSGTSSRVALVVGTSVVFLPVVHQFIASVEIQLFAADERFAKLSQSYEDEQRTLKDRVTALRGEVEQEQQQAVNVGQFIALVKRYTEVEELTPAILNEFISRVVVYAPDRSSGKRTQRIDIQYNFIGEIPDLCPVRLASVPAAFEQVPFSGRLYSYS